MPRAYDKINRSTHLFISCIHSSEIVDRAVLAQFLLHKLKGLPARRSLIRNQPERVYPNLFSSGKDIYFEVLDI